MFSHRVTAPSFATPPPNISSPTPAVFPSLDVADPDQGLGLDVRAEVTPPTARAKLPQPSYAYAGAATALVLARAGLRPRRAVLDPILVDAVREAGADMRFGVAATDLCRDRNARVTGIVGHDEQGSQFTVGAGMTVRELRPVTTGAPVYLSPDDRRAASAPARGRMRYRYTGIES